MVPHFDGSGFRCDHDRCLALAEEFVGLAFTGLLAALLVIDTLAIRRGVHSFWPRLKERGWLFAIIALLLLLASMALLFTVVRPYDQLWLGLVLGALNLVLYIGGWILRERSSRGTVAHSQ